METDQKIWDMERLLEGLSLQTSIDWIPKARTVFMLQLFLHPSNPGAF